MSSTEKNLVDLTAPYANDGKTFSRGKQVQVQSQSQSQSKSQAADNSNTPTMLGSNHKTGSGVLAEGETAAHRKFANGKDISDQLAVSAPKRDHDLHPSKTYEGDGDEVDDSEWD